MVEVVFSGVSVDAGVREGHSIQGLEHAKSGRPGAYEESALVWCAWREVWRWDARGGGQG